jgi:hypothetical protein
VDLALSPADHARHLLGPQPAGEKRRQGVFALAGEDVIEKPRVCGQELLAAAVEERAAGKDGRATAFFQFLGKAAGHRELLRVADGKPDHRRLFAQDEFGEMAHLGGHGRSAPEGLVERLGVGQPRVKFLAPDAGVEQAAVGPAVELLVILAAEGLGRPRQQGLGHEPLGEARSRRAKLLIQVGQELLMGQEIQVQHLDQPLGHAALDKSLEETHARRRRGGG